MATRMYVCESTEHPSNLLMGLNEQRLQGQLCDVTVRVQGHLFKAHINILASAMGYFRDLFLNPNKQVKKEIIDIPMIVNSVGFAKVLDFIYSSQLCLSQSSVMQVLCSACYLQIPYVVDKCQEFIVTHGHVSPPGVTDQRLLSNKGQENQICDLINTPPSPGNELASNGNRGEDGASAGSPLGNEELQVQDLSPGGSMGKSDNMVLIKQENGEGYGNEEQVSGGETNPASRALMQFSHQSRINSLGSDASSQRNGALKILLQNGEGQGPTDPPDVIDHNSLAEYFARNGTSAASDGPFALSQVRRSPPPSSNAIEQHLYSLTKSLAGNSPSKDLASSPTSSVSQYLLSMKKEKPKKEYKCDYCEKLFGRQQHLKRHILTHTGERPYPCNFCEKRFRRSEHLKHHLVKHQQDSDVVSTTSTTTSPALMDLNANRKRQRKPLPTDAYGMSKMMLGSFNNPKTVNHQSQSSEKKTADLIGSNPILMTRLSGGRALDSISERLAFAAAQRGGDLDQKLMQETYGTNADCPVALNLSNKANTTETKITEVDNMQGSPPPTHDEQVTENLEASSPTTSRSDEHQETGLDMSINSADMDGGNLEEVDHSTEEEMANSADMDGGNLEEVDHSTEEDIANSDDSKQSPSSLNGQRTANDMSIDSFATSEVVTSDLKRLFAAMDE